MDSIDVELSGASSTPAERTSTAAAGAGEGSWRRMRRSIAGSTANAGGNGSPGSMRKGSTRNLLSRKSSRAILGSSASTPGASPGASSAALAHRDSDSFSHHSKTAGVSRIWRSLLGGKKTASAMEHSYYRQTKWEGAAKLVRDHGDTVVSVALSSDDTHFAAAGVNKVVRVFHTSQGQQVCEVTAPHVIGSIVFIGRRKLVAGTYGGLVHFYDVCEEAEEAQVKVNEGQQIECMACARGGTRLAVGGKFADVIVYAVQYADANAPCVPDVSEIIRVEPPGTTLALALDEDCRVLATGGDAKIVQLWDVSDGSRRVTRAGGRRPEAQFSCKTQIWSLALTADGGTLAAGTAEGTEVYEVSEVAPEATAHHFADAAITRLNQTIAENNSPSKRHPPRMGGRQSTVSLSPTKRRNSIPGSAEAPTGRSSATATMKAGFNAVAFINAAAPSTAGRSTDPLSTPPPASTRPPSGRRPSMNIRRGGSSKEMEKSDKNDSPTSARLRAWERPLYQVEPLIFLDDCTCSSGGVAFSRAGTKLAVAGDQLVTIVDVATGGTLRKRPSAQRVKCVTLSENGSIVVYGGFDKKVMLLHDSVT